jgi:F0F1-type ATP synthase gamma subunit
MGDEVRLSGLTDEYNRARQTQSTRELAEFGGTAEALQ